jgi:ABC-type nitrate/sulfonate/bicarbonate transport system substrate-binding protein
VTTPSDPATSHPSPDARTGPWSGSTLTRRSLLSTAVRGGASLAAIGGAGALLAACGGSAATSAPRRPTAEEAAATPLMGTVPFQLGWVENVAYAGSFIAQSRGYYRRHGVNVNILSGGPSVSGMPLLVAGKVFVAISDPPTVAGAIAAGADVKIIAAGYQKNPACIMSLAKNPIHKPSDLVGKKIGVGASDDTEWDAFLAANKIAKSSVTTIPAGFDPSPLAAGEWDGYLAFINNEPATFEAKGIKTAVMAFADFGLPSMNEVYTTQTATLKDPAARKKLVAFMAGEIQGWKVAVADPKLATSITVDNYGKSLGLDAKGEYLAALAGNAITVSADTKKHGLFHMSPTLIAQTVKTLKLTGVDATSAMFDTSVLPQVYPLVGA